MLTLDNVNELHKLKLNIKLFGFVYSASYIAAILAFIMLLKSGAEVVMSAGLSVTIGFIFANTQILLLIIANCVISLVFRRLRAESIARLKSKKAQLTREYINDSPADT